MTTLHSTPAVASNQSAAVVLPDLAAKVAAAQRAGDLAYAFAERSGVSLVERVIAYHVAFAETMREMGSPMLCPCDLCVGGRE